MDTSKTKKGPKKFWTKSEIVLVVAIFYLLGTLTPILLYLFLPPDNKHAYTIDPANYIERQQKEKRSFPNEEQLKREKKELWETTTVLRSALYQFVKKNGYMPENLLALTNEYLTGIPKEPLTFSNRVVQTFTSEGGWLYRPRLVSNLNESLLKGSIAEAIIPNIKAEVRNQIPFEPLAVMISLPDHKLQLVSMGKTIREYPVGLGRDGKTPLGEFTIVEKVMNPNEQFFSSNESPYGKRGMELSDSMYAIHGTNETESIGNNDSNGCIRMMNDDIIRLYSMVPLYTSVEITEKNETGKIGTVRKADDFKQNLYDEMDHPDEINESTYYFWAG
ncbi:L,D-transpeptidase [bacterium LRH843]|nr:L,D-transpeptidase [bacterium LRH843]